MAYYINRATPPALPKLQVLSMESMLGADLTTSASTMHHARSPACPNMVRATPGKVRKRYGYRWVESFPAQINGRFSFAGSMLTHAGTCLYAGSTLLHSGFNNARSFAQGVGGKLFILDGNNFWAVSHDGETFTVQSTAEIAYVPKIVISKNPDGTAGSAFEAVNLLSDAWQESFYVNAEYASHTAFQLSFGELSDAGVEIKVLNADGVTYKTLEENTDFTVERTAGTINFITPPGTSPALGVDNVLVRAAKDRTAQREKITKADVCATYAEGVGGQRMFVTGNPEYKNRDFFSAANDPTYFSDLDYSILGREDERIIGYSLVGEHIAAHKGESEGTVYLRTGSVMSETDANGVTTKTYVFKTGNVITGPGALASASFAALAAEPLFLTRSGVYALTPADVTGERYQQQRSYFLNAAITTQTGLEDAAACIFKDYYVLALNGTLYCLDAQQKSYNQNEPYATYQYECFYLPNIGAKTLWCEGGQLFFGTEDGRVCAFNDAHTTGAPLFSDTPDESGTAQPIEASWCTPYLSGPLFYKNKFFTRISVQLAAGANTGFTAHLKEGAAWREIVNAKGAGRFFAWVNFTFEHVSFNAGHSPRVITRKMRARKVDKLQVRLQNHELGQSFGLETFALEFTQSGNFKG